LWDELVQPVRWAKQIAGAARRRAEKQHDPEFCGRPDIKKNVFSWEKRVGKKSFLNDNPCPTREKSMAAKAATRNLAHRPRFGHIVF